MAPHERPRSVHEKRSLDFSLVQPRVEFLPYLDVDDHSSPEVAELCKTSGHILRLSATLEGKGRCSGILLKQTHLKHPDTWPELDGLDDLQDLVREVFDQPHASHEQADGEKGVLLWRQFDPEHNILEEGDPPWAANAWLVLFEDIHVEDDLRRRGMGTMLVRAIMAEVIKRATQEGRTVFAFIKHINFIPDNKRLDSFLLRPRRRKKVAKEKGSVEMFWESLAFERLNNGHLFPSDLDWLFWSPRSRNSSLLFERGAVFPYELPTLLEEEGSDLSELFGS